MENYKLENEIADTPEAKVYLGTNYRDGNTYVLKVMMSDDAALINNEIKILSKTIGICHQNMICYHDSFLMKNKMVIVSKYIVGYGLSKYRDIDVDDCTSPNFIYSLLKQIGGALEFLYNKKVVHRNIKPDNIIYNPITQNFTLVDFGFSADITSTVIRKVENFKYMSPEVCLDMIEKISPSIKEWVNNDVFAFGVTIFYILCDIYPFELKDYRKGLFGTKVVKIYDYDRPNNWTWNIDDNIINIVNLMLTGDKNIITIDTKYRITG